MRPRTLALSLLLLPAAALADAAYDLDMGAAVRAGSLMIEPTVTGPANATLRYDMEVRREGAAGSSTSSQAGTVKLDEQGQGRLATNSLSVSPSDRYEVTVKLFDGNRLVATESKHYGSAAAGSSGSRLLQ